MSKYYLLSTEVHEENKLLKRQGYQGAEERLETLWSARENGPRSYPVEKNENRYF